VTEKFGLPFLYLLSLVPEGRASRKLAVVIEYNLKKIILAALITTLTALCF